MGPSIATVRLDHVGKQLELSIKPALDVTRWSVSGRPIRYLYLIFVILFALLMLAGVLGYRAYPHKANDFSAFHSYSRFIRQYPPMMIYDQELLRRFQDLPNSELFAFLYHPAIMLLVWPLAYLPYDVGYVLWVGIGLVACGVAVAGSRDSWPLALLMVVAPSTLWTALMGQSSLLVAALLIGGLLSSPRHPLLAGLLIGLATYKPQFGILVPVALVAAGQWRTMLAAAATVFCIVLLSILVFGTAVWLAWFHNLSAIIAVHTAHRVWAQIEATVASNLMTVGVSWRLANMIQAITCLISMACVWYCFRQPARRQGENSSLRLETAALAAATFLATPYAYNYDLPLFTGAVLLFIDERRRAKGTFMFREVLAIVAGMMLPCLILSHFLHGFTSLVIAIMLCTILHRIWDLRREQSQSRSPAYLPLPVVLTA